MSLWLSAAHKAAGAARGQASAAIKREATRASRKAPATAAEQWLELWTAAASSGKPRSRNRKRR